MSSASAVPDASAASHPSRALRESGLRARKSLSQSFLADQSAARAIVRAAKLSPDQDEVLEVGPGLGVLTRLLVKQARRVVAVELDPALAERLRTALPDPRLEVRQADVLTFDPATAFEQPYVVVTNLPYHVTSPALRHLLAAGPPYACRLVVMVQHEVAERIAAPPGKMTALAVTLRSQAAVRPIRHVPASAFYPRPKVDSQVLLFQPLPPEQRAVPRPEQAAFDDFVHAGFTQPRKQLANSLAQGLAVAKATATALLESQGISASVRPQTLSVDDWARLFRAHQAA